MTPWEQIVELLEQGEKAQAAGVISTIPPFDREHPREALEFLYRLLGEIA